MRPKTSAIRTARGRSDAQTPRGGVGFEDGVPSAGNGVVALIHNDKVGLKELQASRDGKHRCDVHAKAATVGITMGDEPVGNALIGQRIRDLIHEFDAVT